MRVRPFIRLSALRPLAVRRFVALGSIAAFALIAPPIGRPALARDNTNALAPLITPSAASAPNDGPLADPEKIFLRAKAMWRARSDAPFVKYSLLERYTWRDRAHDNWWQAQYRTSDRSLALQRTVVAEQESARLRGSAIGVNIRWHHAPAKADAFDTNPDSDAFPILDPLIEPDASFGLVRVGPDVALASGKALDPLAASLARAAAASATASPAPQPTATSQIETATQLREVGRVEVVARDYKISLAGTEHLRYGDAYHLTLEPLHDPRRYRLRDLWVATDSFATEKLALDGLFEGKPYDTARWTVSYVPVGDHWYVQQVKTDDTLRFGLDRFVNGLEYDFVQYDFPSDLPQITFQKYTF